MKTALENFNEWLASKEVDRFGQSIQTVLIKAGELGHSEQEVRDACRQIRYWLTANEGTKKVNKLKWGSFILNWLRPKNYQRRGGRLTPSRFE